MSVSSSEGAESGFPFPGCPDSDPRLIRRTALRPQRRFVVNKIIPARPGRRAFQVLHSFEEGFVFPRVLAVKEHFDFERTSEINWLIGLKLTLGCRYLETIE